jgi:hypothetical protein
MAEEYSNMSVRSWATKLKRNTNIDLAFMWREQEECNLRVITMILKDRCNDIERQNILSKLSEKRSLTLYREMNFLWGKRSYIDWCLRKEQSGIAWLLIGVWQLKGIRRNTDKGRCTLCLGEEDVKQILLACLENGSWRIKFLNENKYE